MASTSQSQDDTIVIDSVLCDLNQDQLPTNLQVLKHLFYYTRDTSLRMTLDSAKNIVINKLEDIWQKAGIEIRRKDKIKNKLQKLYSEHIKFQKSRNKKETEFFSNLNDIFDISHENFKRLTKTLHESLLILPVNEIANRIQNLKLPDLSGINICDSKLFEAFATKFHNNYV